MISARTKAALTVAKARGVRLGNPHVGARDSVLVTKANAVQIDNLRGWTAAVLPYVEQARRLGAATPAEIAEAPRSRGLPARCGGHRRAAAQCGGCCSSVRLVPVRPHPCNLSTHQIGREREEAEQRVKWRE